ncbi:Protocadherin gamma-A6 [Triplophysa tibetana]|uniref:Protocadherin gamma-A6 n=1 Tax=Triplophysa tibetana TaxID=1572043 RepID=A0A5A9NLK5_9TELE|nr:Protocadherin gamma-A6 [Triplophysa tibetana]
MTLKKTQSAVDDLEGLDAETIVYDSNQRAEEGGGADCCDERETERLILEFHYSIPEEMEPGAVIGNMARDLGIDVSELTRRRARVVAEGTQKFCELRWETGCLLASEKMDREELCAQSPSCVLQFQLLLEDPLEIYSILLHVQDINDNSPVFENGQIELELLESTAPGKRFPLERAHDPDIAPNSVQHYSISASDYFALEMNAQVDRNAYPELVLKKPLDRESRADHFLTLSGVDGGQPSRSGAASIHIHVLDANDNIPVFKQSVYTVSARENSAPGSVLIKLNVIDLDNRIYGDVSYSFSHVPDKTRGLVLIDPVTGEVRLTGVLDYEEAASHELDVQAKDGGGQSSHCKLMIHVIDENDNAPVIVIKSNSASVPEDTSPGTMVALLHVYDLDAETSGRVTCYVSDDVPFKLVSQVKNDFMLVTDGDLDREKCYHYNITVSAVDAGTPPLFSNKTVAIMVTDINDNSPVFRHSHYRVHVAENQPVGTLLVRVRADDADEGKNAKLFYSLSEDVTAYLSIDTETGEVFSAHSFDYETFTHFHFQVMARDGGSPPFVSNCTFWVFICDQNDNAPVVLYPVELKGHTADDMVPQTAPAGYLVTKVIAVDADAGHNAWLSYEIVGATQPDLFSIGLHCGEIRTVRSFVKNDDTKLTLLVSVTDNGPETLSTTATVNIAIEDGMRVIDQLSARGTDESHVLSDLTVYLIIALVVVSSFCLVLIIAVLYMGLCKYRHVYRSPANLPVFPPTYGPPGYFDTSGFNTVRKDDELNWFLTSSSWKGDFRFGSGFVDFDMQRKTLRSGAIAQDVESFQCHTNSK